MAEEAFDTRELGEALNADDGGGDGTTKLTTIKDLPKEILVSIFMAADDLFWVRHTFPCVCKAWNEIFCSEDASPLHETLEVDFRKEVKAAAAAAAAREGEEGEDEEEEEEVWEWAPGRPVVHASRVIAWAQRRAGSVRGLHLTRGFPGAFEDFSPEDLAELVAVVAPSLTDFSASGGINDLNQKPLWGSLRDSVVPAGRLRMLVVQNIFTDDFQSDVEALGRLAGSLELLVLAHDLDTRCESFRAVESGKGGLPRFPEALCALAELRYLEMIGNEKITALPASISSLKKLKVLNLCRCDLSSLPKELGELSGLELLCVSRNKHLGGTLPEVEAFPAELANLKSLQDLSFAECGLRSVPAYVGELKSLELLDLSFNEDLENAGLPAELANLKTLRRLRLSNCGLRTVPAFIGELKSLELLDLSCNDRLQFDAPLDFLIEGCPRLRQLKLGGAHKLTPESVAHLKALHAKWCAKNPATAVLQV